MSCVYVIGIEGLSIVKIGSTSGDPMRRMKELQTGLPFQLKLLTAFPCETPAVIEKRIHRILHESRERGEWFEISLSAINDAFLLALETPDIPPFEEKIIPPDTMGQRLQALRKATGERQEDVARACGVHSNTYARIERDEFEGINTTVLIALARHFRCSADDLLGLDIKDARV